jgi:peptide chain release factor 3
MAVALLIQPMKLFSLYFKIQANMNPAHRDRLFHAYSAPVFFTKGMSVYHVTGKESIKLSQPQQFLAQERTIIVRSLSW